MPSSVLSLYGICFTALITAAWAEDNCGAEGGTKLPCPPSLLSEVNQGSIVCQENDSDSTGFLTREVRSDGQVVVADNRWVTSGFPASQYTRCWSWLQGDVTDQPASGAAVNNAGWGTTVVVKSINGHSEANNTVVALISAAASAIFKFTLKEYVKADDGPGSERTCRYWSAQVDSDKFFSTLSDHVDELDADDARALLNGDAFKLVWGWSDDVWSTASETFQCPCVWACTGCNASQADVIARPFSYRDQRRLQYTEVGGSAAQAVQPLAVMVTVLALLVLRL